MEGGRCSAAAVAAETEMGGEIDPATPVGDGCDDGVVCEAPLFKP